MIYLFRAGFALLLALIRRYETAAEVDHKQARPAVKEGVAR
jgi:hypothetical protein